MRRKSEDFATDDKEALDRSGRAWPKAPWHGRRARRPSFARKGRRQKHRCAVDRGGSCFAPKGFRLAVAHYNGATLWFPNAANARPKSSNGRARTWASHSARMANSSSPACRSRRCTVGGWRTASTCACRVIRRGFARSAGPQAGISGDVRRRAAHPMAVRRQGWSHGTQPKVVARSKPA